MAIDMQHLKQLLEAPSERLDVELKGWLDLADNGQRGTLAKCLIALANHGGGIAIIGFDDAGTPAQNRPATLDAFGQDEINDILDRYADPAMHCTTQRVTRDADGLDYPVILVLEFPGFCGHLKMVSPKALGASHVQANECWKGP